MLDYAALAAISAVIREGSFERAATVLRITPSAVSQRVRGLEERLGTILVVRGQPCAPTDVGRRLCAHFDQVQLLEADITPTLVNENTDQPPTFRVAVNADSLATWFPEAVAAFGRASSMLLELTLDDETHTTNRLRSGEVLAAVTGDPEPVQGCRTIKLGALRYAACASPDFMTRHFRRGLNGDTLARAPHMRFDRRDELQARWASEAHAIDLVGPTHWVPSAHGFIDLGLAGFAWGLHPLPLVETHITTGGLIELPPRKRIDVPLYWTVARLHASSLRCLTTVVSAAAERHLTT